MKRRIFHVDVNSAFLSWEAARRTARGEADLRLIPSCIGGDPKKRTSVVLAKSIPAKKFGVVTGEPMGAALRKCPDLIAVETDFALYRQCSEAFLSVCREFAPVVQQFSIDECFLDMTGTNELYPDPVAAAYLLKNTIRDRLGFTVNIGISENRLLAKTASDFEKPDRVHTLFQNEIKEKFWPLPVGDLIGVGKSAEEKLRKYRIRTIGDLAAADQTFLIAQFGQKFGTQLKRHAWGIDDSPVEAQQAEAKSYSMMTTLEENVTTIERAQAILTALADTLCYRMRRDGAKAACVAVTLRGNDFRSRSHQRKLSDPTDVTAEITAAARGLLPEMWRDKEALRLIGLALTDIDRGEEGQLSLFDNPRREKERALDRTMDEIRAKYGTASISRGMVKERDRIGRKFRADADHKE